MRHPSVGESRRTGEALPAATRVLMLVHAAALDLFRPAGAGTGAPDASGPQPAERLLQQLLAANQAAGLTLAPLLVHGLEEWEAAFAARGDAAPDALWVIEHPAWTVHAARIVALAARRRVPVAASVPRWAEAGALLTYGPNLEAMFRGAAAYVDKILRGADPAVLPVEQPTTFELLLNQGTARTLGLALPPSLLAQATAVVP